MLKINKLFLFIGILTNVYGTSINESPLQEAPLDHNANKNTFFNKYINKTNLLKFGLVIGVVGGVILLLCGIKKLFPGDKTDENEEKKENTLIAIQNFVQENHSSDKIYIIKDSSITIKIRFIHSNSTQIIMYNNYISSTKQYLSIQIENHSIVFTVPGNIIDKTFLKQRKKQSESINSQNKLINTLLKYTYDHNIFNTRYDSNKSNKLFVIPLSSSQGKQIINEIFTDELKEIITQQHPKK
jgi:hypothetical protein